MNIYYFYAYNDLNLAQGTLEISFVPANDKTEVLESEQYLSAVENGYSVSRIYKISNKLCETFNNFSKEDKMHFILLHTEIEK